MRLLPRGRGGALLRAFVAAVVVIGFTAGTTAVAGLLQIKQFVHDLNLTKPLTSTDLTPPSPGSPETLLLIGVDHRVGEGSGPGNTDTMMLVRIDDSSKTINLLSIPRDLGVNIPGVGFSKVNAAYADGGNQGATLLLQTLQQDVFPGLEVNHILIMDFQSFADLVTSLGCVYSAVDHRYYNHSLGPAVPANNFSSIDIEPGYQKLCGDNGAPNSALAFVRFRHNDSDLVRESRQQDFLRWAKSQFTTGQLLAKQSQLEKDFAEDVQTDKQLHTTDAVDDLFGLAFNADGSELNSITFPTTGTVDSPTVGDYLTFSQAQAQQAYAQFMTPTTSTPKVGHVALGSGMVKPKGKKHAVPAFQLPDGMIADPGDGKSQAGQLGNVGLPIYYPQDIPEGFSYCFTITANCDEGTNPTSAYDGAYPRKYTIDGPDNRQYPAYVFTLVESSGGETDMASGQYFNVQGTTWQDPPLLRDPSLVRKVNGKKLDIYSQGGLVSTVAWHTPRGVYWIQNTLQNVIPNEQMVAMAATLAAAGR
ncbi:MAG TPA: LCP family protein [Solirubrobacteraceae bacterium]|nr:LCP family protein [Solirubrobacteraceae bacterium]